MPRQAVWQAIFAVPKIDEMGTGLILHEKNCMITLEFFHIALVIKFINQEKNITWLLNKMHNNYFIRIIKTKIITDFYIKWNIKKETRTNIRFVRNFLTIHRHILYILVSIYLLYIAFVLIRKLK